MAKHRRVLVFSASFGGGHASAAGSIKQWFTSHHPEVEVRVVDFFDHFAPSLNVVGKFAYGQSVQFFPELYGTFFDLTNKVPNNPFVHELAHMGYRAAAEYIDAYRPDAVISAYPIAGGVVADMKTDRSLVSATVITDYGAHRQWLHPATDMYFVASDEVESDLISLGIRP